MKLIGNNERCSSGANRQTTFTGHLSTCRATFLTCSNIPVLLTCSSGEPQNHRLNISTLFIFFITLYKPHHFIFYFFYVCVDEFDLVLQNWIFCFVSFFLFSFFFFICFCSSYGCFLSFFLFFFFFFYLFLFFIWLFFMFFFFLFYLFFRFSFAEVQFM